MCFHYPTERKSEYEKNICIRLYHHRASRLFTWHGVKEDTANTVEKVGNGIEHGWDKTQSAVKKGGNAVGRGISHVGEKIENATE